MCLEFAGRRGRAQGEKDKQITWSESETNWVGRGKGIGGGGGPAPQGTAARGLFVAQLTYRSEGVCLSVLSFAASAHGRKREAGSSQVGGYTLVQSCTRVPSSPQPVGSGAAGGSDTRLPE